MAVGKVNVIGANLKFNKPLRNIETSMGYAQGLLNSMPRYGFSKTKVRIFPHVFVLQEVAAKINTLTKQRSPNISQLRMNVGAQDIHWTEDGSFTGAPLSPGDLGKIGVKHTLIGHSETKVHFGVTDKQVAQKLEAALKAQIFATVCIGEDIKEKEAGKTAEVLERQITEGIIPALEKNTDYPLFDIAYEPLYAIRGFAEMMGLEPKSAQISDIEFAHGFIRKVLKKHGFHKLALNLDILYGGSSKEENARELLFQPFINGLLVGTASWDIGSLLGMIRIAEEVG